MQKSCMSVFKYLILTAARLKYSVEEALLLASWKVQELRERERQLLCCVRKKEKERGGEMEKRGRRDTAIFDDNFVAMRSKLLELEAALKHSLPWKSIQRHTTALWFCSLGAAFVLWHNRFWYRLKHTAGEKHCCCFNYSENRYRELSDWAKAMNFACAKTHCRNHMAPGDE